MKFWGSGARALAVCAGLASLPSVAGSQETVPVDPVEQSTAAQDEPAAPDGSPDSASDVVIPKLTTMVIEILEPLGSKSSTSLQTYRIALREPIVIDGVELVPAGVTGLGEVVHAKKAGGMGAAGELVLAARYLDFEGRQMRLRSMVLAGPPTGKDRIGTVNAINTAGAATLLPISLIGYFIGGGNIEIPAGTLANAKLAADFTIAAPAPPTPNEAEVPADNKDSAPEVGGDIETEGK
jgi:hypothetical protein